MHKNKEIESTNYIRAGIWGGFLGGVYGFLTSLFGQNIVGALYLLSSFLTKCDELECFWQVTILSIIFGFIIGCFTNWFIRMLNKLTN